MSPNTFDSIGQVLHNVLPTPDAVGNKDLAQYRAEDEREPMPDVQPKTLTTVDKAGQKQHRPTVALDPVTHNAVFRDTAERGRYMEDLLNQGVIPPHLNSVAKIENAYKILTQIGLPWEVNLTKVYYVGSQLTLYVAPALAACKATGLLETWTIEYRNKENVLLTNENMVDFEAVACAVVGKRRDETSPVMGTFTLAEAETAGLVQKNQTYKKYPKAMLYWRAAARVLTVLFPEILGGIPLQGVDDMVALTDDDGKQLRASDGSAIYRQRQERVKGKLNSLLGDGQ